MTPTTCCSGREMRPGSRVNLDCEPAFDYGDLRPNELLSPRYHEAIASSRRGWTCSCGSVSTCGSGSRGRGRARTILREGDVRRSPRFGWSTHPLPKDQDDAEMLGRLPALA